MLSNIIAKRALLLSTSTRGFALNTSHLNSALKDPEHINWPQFFAGVKPADVAGSDSQSVG